jgi:hypothetical protein
MALPKHQMVLKRSLGEISRETLPEGEILDGSIHGLKLKSIYYAAKNQLNKKPEVTSPLGRSGIRPSYPKFRLPSVSLIEYIPSYLTHSYVVNI